MEEIWAMVDGFQNTEVSNLGRIRSLFRGGCKIRTPHISENGYAVISLQRSTEKKAKRVHVLVAAAFVGPNPGGMDVNHIDGVKTNNVASNLEFMTRSENCKHGFKLGLSYTPFRERGEKHCRSKLTDSAVLSIRERHASGARLRDLAQEHSISYYTAWDLVKRRSWTHI